MKNKIIATTLLFIASMVQAADGNALEGSSEVTSMILCKDGYATATALGKTAYHECPGESQEAIVDEMFDKFSQGACAHFTKETILASSCGRSVTCPGFKEEFENLILNNLTEGISQKFNGFDVSDDYQLKMKEVIKEIFLLFKDESDRKKFIENIEDGIQAVQQVFALFSGDDE